MTRPASYETPLPVSAANHYLLIGTGTVSTSRKITIFTNESGQSIRLPDDKVVIADGTGYKASDSFSQSAASLTYGYLHNDGSGTLVGFWSLPDIQELIIDLRMGVSSLRFGSATPFLQISGGGAWGEGGASIPDAFTAGAGAGLTLDLNGNLIATLLLQSDYRFWRVLDTDYGTETWQDSSTRLAISLGIKF